MGGLCGAMAASTSEEENGTKAKEGESWEDEVKMEDFYTDAVKYWEVRTRERRGSECVGWTLY